MELRVNPRTIVKGCVLAKAMSWLAALEVEVLLVWVGIIRECDSVIDSMLALQLSHFSSFFHIDRLSKVAGGCHVSLFGFPSSSYIWFLKNVKKKNVTYHAC